MTFAYNSAIPASGNSPSADQPIMQANALSISNIIAVDHVGFNAANGGNHTLIHQIPQGTWNPVTRVITPGSPPGKNQVQALQYTPDTTGGLADTQLFNVTNLGGISQLTGNLATQDGWVWCGGILFQWGVFALPNTGNPAQGVITFKDRVAGAIPFPNNIFNVQLTLVCKVPSTSTAPGIISVVQNSASATSFKWNLSQASSSYTFCFWFAIGQ